MRIAYIAPYQGPGLLERRPIVLNRSLANTIKLELIAKALKAASHELEVISQGEVVENQCRFYPFFSEPLPAESNVPVFYASALPIKRLKVLWSSWRTLRLFRARHRVSPFDVAIIWNLKHPQLICADYAVRRMKVPVVLEYEDDSFVSISGEPAKRAFGYSGFASRVLRKVSGCAACSPRLLAQLPDGIPKLLLRGTIGEDLVACSERSQDAKRNWVLFSGTHCAQYRIPSLIAAWAKAGLSDWELHITGAGPETPALRKLAGNDGTIRFHGLVSRQELVRLMCSAKFCMNPHELSRTPGNVFAFKIIEYLAAGAHVITTPMGPVEKELEAGISYMQDNDAESIASALKLAIAERRWERTAAPQVIQAYGPAAVSKSLNLLLEEARAEFECRLEPNARFAAARA